MPTLSILRGIGRLASGAGRRENPAWPVVVSNLSIFGDEAPTPSDMKNLLASLRTFPTTAACLNKLIALSSAVPIYQADRKTGDRLDRPRLVNWAGEDLLRRPNPGEGGKFFLMKSYQQLAATGNLYQCVGNTMQDPKELWLLESDAMRPRLSRDNQYPFASFVYHGRARKETIDADRVIFTRRPHHSDPVYGLSFLDECADSLEFLYLSRRYNKALLKRGGRTGGFLFLKGGIGDIERQRIEQQLEKRQGAEGAGKVAVVGSQDGDFKPDTSLPRDLEHETTILEAKLEVYNVFGFMPALFATRDVNRSNLREAKASAYEDAVRPFLELWLEQFNAAPLCVAAGVQMMADWKAVEALQPNILEKAQAMAMLLDRQVATPNEAAALFGLQKKEWGDQPSRPPVAWLSALAPPGAEVSDAAIEGKVATEAGKVAAGGLPEEERDAALVEAILSRAGPAFDTRAERISLRIIARAVERLEEDLRELRTRKESPVTARSDASADDPPSPATEGGDGSDGPDPDAGDTAFEARVAVALAALDASTCAGCRGWAEGDGEDEPRRARLAAKAGDSMHRRENRWVSRLGGLFTELEEEVLGTLETLSANLGRSARGNGDGEDEGPAVPDFWTDVEWFDRLAAEERWGVEVKFLGESDMRAGMKDKAEILGEFLDDVTIDLDDPQIRRFLDTVIGSKVTKMTDTTVATLREIVERAVEEKVTVGELELRLQEEFRWSRRVRARQIARTEVGMLYTEGGILAMQQNGVDKHSWLSSRDSNVRLAHRAADGQIVRVGEDFVMTDPETGDTSHGKGPGQMDKAWASVGCRCTTAPEVL